MKATQFIKDHGLELAREIVDDAPAGTNFYCHVYKMGNITIRSSWCDKKDSLHNISLSDLKRLVESVDLFKELKTKKNANREFMKACMRGQTERANQIKRAIDAHDAIYGKKGASHE